VITVEQQGSEIEMLVDYRKLYDNAMCELIASQNPAPAVV
jgi:hypothetical protein